MGYYQDVGFLQNVSAVHSPVIHSGADTDVLCQNNTGVPEVHIKKMHYTSLPTVICYLEWEVTLF